MSLREVIKDVPELVIRLCIKIHGAKRIKELVEELSQEKDSTS